MAILPARSARRPCARTAPAHRLCGDRERMSLEARDTAPAPRSSALASGPPLQARADRALHANARRQPAEGSAL
eukprot:scaffold240954_cov27-Prasinocladus_malaysianus.AAC.1